MFWLAENLIQTLLDQPETGMGYQRVEATLRDNKTKPGIAFNAELLILDDEMRPFGHPYAAMLKNSVEASGAKIKTLRALPSVAGTGRTEAIRALLKKAGPAKDAPTEKTKAGEVFKRFSAYRNDRRITPDGGLRQGTYATTEEDAEHVETGQDAVERYALPNPMPASHRFTIEPHKDTDIRRGEAQPANGHRGGGVEVIFSKGTQKKTVTGYKKLPDKDAMRVKLDQQWTKQLLELPESGMGFQRVDIRFTDGRELKGIIVLNAEEIELPDDFTQAEIKSITLHAS